MRHRSRKYHLLCRPRDDHPERRDRGHGSMARDSLRISAAQRQRLRNLLRRARQTSGGIWHRNRDLRRRMVRGRIASSEWRNFHSLLAIRYSPLAFPLPFSVSSPICSTDTTCSSSAVSNTMTPWVERPAIRMPSTGQRISCPLSVTSMIWSLSSTGNDATSLPLRPFTDIATMPLPPRPVVRYSNDDERLP